MMEKAKRLSENCDFEGAERILREITQIEPANYYAFDLLGFILYFQNRFKDAENACMESLSVAPKNAYAMKGLGLSLVAQGRLANGLNWLRKAIAQKPTWFDPRWDALVVCGEHKLKDEAVRLIEEMWNIFPKEHKSIRKLAEHFEFEIPGALL